MFLINVLLIDMAKKNKKLLWICFPVFAVLLVLIFHQAIISHFLENSIQRLSQQAVGSSLQAEAIIREGSSLIFEGPKIEGNAAFEAEKMIVEFQLKPLSLELDLRVRLLKPKVEIAESVAELKKRFNSFSRSSWLSINPQIEIELGTLILHGKDGQVQTVFVDCTSDQLKINLTDPVHTADFCQVTFLNESQALVEAHSLELKHVQQALAVLWPEYRNFSVSQGLVHIKGLAQIDKRQLSGFTGKASASDVVFTYLPWGLQGEIKEAVLEYEPDKKTGPIGKLEFLQGSHFAFMKDLKPYWEIKHVLGGVYLKNHDTIKVAFEGSCLHHHRLSEMHIDGQGHFGDRDKTNLDLKVCLAQSNSSDVSARFLIQEHDNHRYSADIYLSQFGPHEFELLQALLSSANSSLKNNYKIESGVLEASLKAYASSFKLTEIKLEKIDLSDFQVVNPSKNSSLSFERLKGEASVNLLRQDFYQHINAELSVTKGKIQKKRSNGEYWNFNDIDMQLKLEDGIVRDSHLKGDFGGLEGFIKMDWLSPDELVNLKVKGQTGKLIALLPNKFKESVSKNLKSDQVEMTAGLIRKQNGGKVNGELLFSGPNEMSDRIAFGFDLEHIQEGFWGAWPIHEASFTFFESLSSEALQKVFPILAAPLAHFNGKMLKKELGVTGYLLQNGWFEARQLPLEQYLSPFLFHENQLALKGIGDFKGHFDHADLAVRYGATSLSLENDNMAIDVASISDGLGEFYYSFDKGSSFGCIPIVNGTYFEKTHGLLFTDIKADVLLVDKKVHIPDIETFCNGVYFAGSVDIDYESPFKGFFDVDVTAHTITGKVSQVQHIFSHFDKPLIFLKLPIEGDIALHKKGAQLNFSFFPFDYQMQAIFQGMVSDGRLLNPSGDVDLQEFSVSIDYDHMANRLEFSDMQGAVFVGTPHHVEEYVLSGDHIRFHDFSRNLAEFDFWIGDKKRDVVRIAGKTIPAQVGKDGEYVEFLIDQNLTHFGDVHPNSFRLVMKDWERIHHFDLDLQFNLSTLLHDLQRFGRTGLFFLSRNLLKEVNDIKMAKGDFAMHLHYDDLINALSMSLNGDAVTIGPYSVQKFALNGKKQKNRWYLDQLQIDGLNLAAEVQRLENSWLVDFLGVRYGDALLIGLEGEYKHGDEALSAKVNLFEMDLNRLNELPHLKKFVSDLQPKGHMRATGSMRFDVGKGPVGFRADLLLNGFLSGLKLGNVDFGDIANVSCHLNTARGITFRQIKTVLQKNSLELGEIDLEKFDYDFVSEDLNLEGLKFHIPAERLPLCVDHLRSSFPELLSSSVIETLSCIKKEGQFQGVANLKVNKPDFYLHVALPQGIYTFKESSHELNEFALDYTPHELKVTTQYRIQQKPLWLTLIAEAPHLNLGHLYVSDNPSGATDGLKVQWQLDPEKGVQVQKAQGLLSGLAINVCQNENFPHLNKIRRFSGEIGFNALEASSLLPAEFADQIKRWKIGRGYRLNGLWTFNEKNSSLSFLGKLLAEDFEMGGYRFHDLTADVDYSPAGLTIKEIKVSDQAFGLYFDQLKLTQDKQKRWEFFTSNIHMNEFRPSLLRATDAKQSNKVKPLVFQRIELHDLKGILGSPETFQGHGSLHFDNSKKKSDVFPLFAIPAEILTRIGLNLDVMNPASGTVFYEIKDEKIKLIKLKDVYSEGKLSKFYLPNTGYQSFIDFLGNLHLQIRLKQYSVLFKFAEMFTITIGGTIHKPQYSLSKQPRKGGETIVIEEPVIHAN